MNWMMVYICLLPPPPAHFLFSFCKQKIILCTGGNEQSQQSMQRSCWILEERHRKVTSAVGSICLTDFSLEKISCRENGQQRIKLLVRSSATASSESGEFVMQERDHQHPKIKGRRKGDSITLWDETVLIF